MQIKPGATVYLASLFFTPDGIPTAYKTLSAYARTYGMIVLMANFCGPSWNDCTSVGDSAFWDNRGKLIARMNSQDPGLLVIEKIADHWVGKSRIYE